MTKIKRWLKKWWDIETEFTNSFLPWWVQLLLGIIVFIVSVWLTTFFL